MAKVKSGPNKASGDTVKDCARQDDETKTLELAPSVNQPTGSQPEGDQGSAPSPSFSIGMRQLILKGEQKSSVQLSDEHQHIVDKACRDSAKMRCDPPANPLKGLEWVRYAADVLERNRACGVLIGSQLEALLNPGEERQPKDIDIMVLSRDFNPASINEPTVKQIDWWLPTEVEIMVYEEQRYRNLNQTFWRNSVNQALFFTLEIEPVKDFHGLLIPNRDLYARIRLTEILASNPEICEQNDAAIENAITSRFRGSSNIKPNIDRSMPIALLPDSLEGLKLEPLSRARRVAVATREGYNQDTAQKLGGGSIADLVQSWLAKTS